MALHKKGKYRYGDSQLDIRDELLKFSRNNAYPTEHYADAVCSCGGKIFHLMIDDEQGAAVRVCIACGLNHPIGDSGEYLDDAELRQAGCPCGGPDFEITAGVALYESSEEVKWFYLGCRCVKCELTACYGEWKNEYDGFRELLSRV